MSPSSSDLAKFVSDCDTEYRTQLAKIPLFDEANSRAWSDAQKQFFVKVFYHLRGHFHDFLWVVGNFSPSPVEKNIVLKNISEEFGNPHRSHELLYFDFANALGVDIKQEIITEENNLPFCYKFNKAHKTWLLTHNWYEKFAAFSSYEHLDNIDYPYLLKLAQSFGLSDDALLFFKVHAKVTHYEATQELLENIWQKDSQSIKNGFAFILKQQLEMWNNLSSAILNIPKNNGNF